MHIVFALPPLAETGGGGGTDYIHGMVAALRGLGHKADIIESADPELPQGVQLVIDGMLLPRLLPRLEALAEAGAAALVHHIAAAAKREEASRQVVWAAEATMLPRLRRVIATSRPVAEQLQTEFGVSADPVLPGARDLPRNEPGEGEVNVLAVGVLTKRKGHDILLRAMSRLPDLAWRLVIAGDSGREPGHAAELAALIEELGLSERATLLADPGAEMLERAWRSAGLFALATRWEGYAAAVAEALRRGIPVVVTDGGEAGGFVAPKAGAVCPLDDPATFGKCLRRLLFDHALRAEMAEGAWRAGQALPGWPQQAQAFVAMLEA